MYIYNINIHRRDRTCINIFVNGDVSQETAPRCRLSDSWSHDNKTSIERLVRRLFSQRFSDFNCKRS